MQAAQLVQYVADLAGVSGCFIASPDGRVVTAQLPSIFDEEMVSSTIKNGTNVLETFRSELPDCDEVHFDMSTVSIYLRAIGGDTLFVLLESSDELGPVRIAANVGAKRYQPGEVSAAPAVETTATTSPLKTKSAWGFGSKSIPAEPKEEKPKKSRGIWG